MDPAKRAALTALRAVYDPEIGLDLITLGLVYSVDVLPDALRVRLTLTSRGCPLGESIMGMAQEALVGISGERRVDLGLVWSPPWSPEMITEDGRAVLRGG